MRLPTAGRRRETYTVTVAKRRQQAGPGSTLSPQSHVTSSPSSPSEDKLKSATHDLFELVARAQSSRLDDQRCVLPSYFSQQNSRDDSKQQQQPQQPPTTPTTVVSPPPPGSQRLLEAALRGPGPYPMLILPPGGGYWRDDGPALQDTTPGTTPNSPRTPPCGRHELEIDETATCYRQHFMGKEHCNLIVEDATLGPALLSLRLEEDSASTRVLLRLRSGTRHRVLSAQETAHLQGPAQLARLVSEEVSGSERFSPVLCPRAAELIAGYDEHALASTFKFGVVQQRRGQVTEEHMFANRAPTPALLDFLDLVGTRVKLRDHRGYRGGLDTQFGQTGEETVYQVFRERELIFHVAPMLPYADNDPQQLQRKRHIGNDIVAIIFQEENTPFAPDLIASHFLHVFIVVQPIHTPTLRYRVSVTAREGVPQFGPALPTGGELHPTELREWMLTKLVNAEAAACKASKFASLECRTRASLLSSLSDELRMRTRQFLGETAAACSPERSSRNGDSSSGGPGSRFISTVRKAISARSRPAVTSTGDLQAAAVGSQNGTGGRSRAAPPPESSPSSGRVTLNSVGSSSGGGDLSRRSSGGGGGSGAGSGASSPDLPTHRPARLVSCESDASSVGSSGGDAEVGAGGGAYAGDSDTGLESMSSAETPRDPNPGACGRCGGGAGAAQEPQENGVARSAQQLEALGQEVARLKCDKLDLLRHNVICQRDVKALTEQTLQLRAELSAASTELRRLRALLRECAFSSDVSDV